MNTVKEDIISGNIKTYPKKKLAIGGIAIIAILFLIFNIFSGGDKAGAEKAAQNSAQALITAIEHDTNENLKKFVLTCEPAQQKDKNSGVWNMVNGISRARGTNDYDHSIGKPEKVTVKGDTAEVVIPYTKHHKANVTSSSDETRYLSSGCFFTAPFALTAVLSPRTYGQAPGHPPRCPARGRRRATGR